MKRSEKEAREQLKKKHAVIVTKKGSVAGNLKDPADWETAPTTTLKHGLISRLTGGSPREVR